jgi:hypothetical protein
MSYAKPGKGLRSFGVVRQDQRRRLSIRDGRSSLVYAPRQRELASMLGYRFLAC